MTLEDALRKIVREELAVVLEAIRKPTVEAEILDSEGAALMLKMPVDTLRKKAARGDVPSFKEGTLVRFRVSELREYVKTRKR